MDQAKQLLLIQYLLSSHELFTKVSPIIKPSYFDVKLARSVKFICEYVEKYKGMPSGEQISAETGINVTTKSLTKQELQYAENEMEEFCRNSAIEGAIMASPALLASGDFGKIEKLIRDAITVGLQRNIGLDYFADPEERLKKLATANPMTPTRWARLDKYLGGGINRKEMIIFAAPPGVGKSLTMANLAKNLISQGLNGVYITLELSEEVTCKRFDSMFSGIAQTEILSNISKVASELRRQSGTMGRLFVKRFPESSTNTNHIRAYLKEFEIVNGFLPDFLVVDYLDLMCSVTQVSAENTFIKDKYVSEELRALANEYDLMMITASQLNRGAQMLENIEDLSQANIAGGISKVNTCDNLVAIIQTPQMKARNEMMYKLLKTRSSNGVGSYYMLKFNGINLLLENMEEDADTGGSSLADKVGSYAQSRPINNPSQPQSSSNKMDVLNLPFQV